MARRMSVWLRRPLTWLAVGAAGLLGMVMTFSYIGGFLDPLGHLSDAPIAVVNEDAGVPGQDLAAGEQVQQELTSHDEGGAIDWQVLSSRDEAVRRLRDNEIWGALVLPQSFSADIAAIGAGAATGTAAPPAELEVLANEGAGLFPDSFFERLSTTAAASASEAVNQQLVGILSQGGVTVAPAAAASVGQPVVADRTAVVALPDKAGRGLAPFYLAVMIGLTGFLAASIANIVVDLERGTEHLELMGHELDLTVGDGRPWARFVAKAVCTEVGAAAGALLAVLTAVGILGMDVSSAPRTYAVAVLGGTAVGLLSLVFLLLFGLAGELLGVLFTTIFGVPSALGVYPEEALPGVFRWIATWHPLRYLTDALRSIAFFDGSGAGLGRGVTVLAIWLVVAALLAVAIAGLQERDRRPRRAAVTRPVPSH